ncbi:hypothetical protein [Micromonospora globbae]|uniref:hypothetical protein n=1 Tax=Micromonospora globbae TaxID=1894969 RepID=UPI00131551E2|nr:hypothetical protein [Micromonospora globbae]
MSLSVLNSLTPAAPTQLQLQTIKYLGGSIFRTNLALSANPADLVSPALGLRLRAAPDRWVHIRPLERGCQVPGQPLASIDFLGYVPQRNRDRDKVRLSIYVCHGRQSATADHVTGGRFGGEDAETLVLAPIQSVYVSH